MLLNKYCGALHLTIFIKCFMLQILRRTAPLQSMKTKGTVLFGAERTVPLIASLI